MIRYIQKKLRPGWHYNDGKRAVVTRATTFLRQIDWDVCMNDIPVVYFRVNIYFDEDKIKIQQQNSDEISENQFYSSGIVYKKSDSTFSIRNESYTSIHNVIHKFF